MLSFYRRYKLLFQAVLYGIVGLGMFFFIRLSSTSGQRTGYGDSLFFGPLHDVWAPLGDSFPLDILVTFLSFGACFYVIMLVGPMRPKPPAEGWRLVRNAMAGTFIAFGGVTATIITTVINWFAGLEAFVVIGVTGNVLMVACFGLAKGMQLVEACWHDLHHPKRPHLTLVKG